MFYKRISDLIPLNPARNTDVYDPASPTASKATSVDPESLQNDAQSSSLSRGWQIAKSYNPRTLWIEVSQSFGKEGDKYTPVESSPNFLRNQVESTQLETILDGGTYPLSHNTDSSSVGSNTSFLDYEATSPENFTNVHGFVSRRCSLQELFMNIPEMYIGELKSDVGIFNSIYVKDLVGSVQAVWADVAERYMVDTSANESIPDVGDLIVFGDESGNDKYEICKAEGITGINFTKNGTNDTDLSFFENMGREGQAVVSKRPGITLNSNVDLSSSKNVVLTGRSDIKITLTPPIPFLTNDYESIKQIFTDPFSSYDLNSNNIIYVWHDVIFNKFLNGSCKLRGGLKLTGGCGSSARIKISNKSVFSQYNDRPTIGVTLSSISKDNIIENQTEKIKIDSSTLGLSQIVDEETEETKYFYFGQRVYLINDTFYWADSATTNNIVYDLSRITVLTEAVLNLGF